MTQLFFPPQSDVKQSKVYCYINNLTNIAIAKIRGLENRHCERVIFPGEKFLFMANDDCELEIYQQTNSGIIKDNIACSQLKVVEE